jgi:hypothetical protein
MTKLAPPNPYASKVDSAKSPTLPSDAFLMALLIFYVVCRNTQGGWGWDNREVVTENRGELEDSVVPGETTKESKSLEHSSILVLHPAWFIVRNKLQNNTMQY